MDGSINGNMNYETDDVIDTGPVFTVGSGADVDFQSDASITLEPGFHAQPGSRFHAFINTSPKNGRLALGSEERIGESVAEQTARDGDVQPRLDEANLQHALHKAAEAVPTAFSLSQNYPTIPPRRFHMP